MSQALSNFLENLPEIVSPEALADILGIKKQAIYQRLWRVEHGQAASGALPTILSIPGSNRIGFLKADVANWFLEAQQAQSQRNRNPKPRRGRPSIKSKMEGAHHG